jgi:hypothetical protein
MGQFFGAGRTASAITVGRDERRVSQAARPNGKNENRPRNQGYAWTPLVTTSTGDRGIWTGDVFQCGTYTRILDKPGSA